MDEALDVGAVFQASPNPYMVVDRDLRYVAVNRAYLAATSRREDELIGRRITDVFPHDPLDPNNENARRLVTSLRRVLETGQPDALPFIHYRIEVPGPGGRRYEDRYWSATHTPVPASGAGPNGPIPYVLQHTVDVTAMYQRTPGGEASGATSSQVAAGVLGRAQLTQQQNALLDQDVRRLLRIFDQAPGFLSYLSGPEHVFELANAAYSQLVGGRPLQGRTVREALPEIDPGYFQLLDRVYETGETFVGRSMPVKLSRAPGGAIEDVFVDFVYQPITDASGQIAGVLVMGQDLTQQKRGEQEREGLRSAAATVQAELEAIFESFPEALFVGDETGVKRANASARDILGYESMGQVLRRQPALVAELHPRRADSGEPIPAGETVYAKALRGEASRMEVIISDWKMGRPRHIFSSGAPIRRDDQTVGAVVAMLDITAQKQAQTEAQQLARVLDETRDFVGIADLDGCPLFVNQAALRLIGLPDLATARRLPVVEYFVPAERERVRHEVLPAAMRDGYWEGELHFQHQKTGEAIPVLYTVFPLHDNSGRMNALATITRDLRAQKAADSERVRLLENERAARAEAEQANELKDQFLAVVSHELRTPLAAILGWTQMWKSGTLSPEKRQRAVEAIERNARIQAQLIEDLLDVSRIISGKLELDREPVELAAVVGAAVETVRPAAEAKGVTLASSVDGTGQVMGDGRRLQQVVWNLLSNAVKFTGSGGHVLLTVGRRAESVEIVVSDTGSGIAADFLPHVFERFRQAGGREARGKGGLGLGLSIVRHVVEAHGGSVSAASPGEGQGATFVVRLPLAPVDKRASARHDDDNVVDASFAVPEILRGLALLVVEDEADLREYLRTLLQHCGAAVTVVDSAAAGLEALAHARPDVIISDITMPGEDGYTFIQRVRALPEKEGGRTPAVALTGQARKEDRTRALLAGFQNHVTKPVAVGELLAVVAALAAPAKRS